MKKNGFTLIETLVIIGLLSTLIILSVTTVGDLFKNGKEKAIADRKEYYKAVINNYLTDQKIKGEPVVVPYTFKKLSDAGYIKDNECNSITMKKINLDTSTFTILNEKVNEVIITDTDTQCDSTSLSGT